MKKIFIPTTLAALAMLALTSRSAFAQDVFNFTFDDPVVPVPPTAPAVPGGQFFPSPPLNIGQDTDVFYTLDGYDLMSGMNNVEAIEKQITEIDKTIASVDRDLAQARRDKDETRIARYQSMRDSLRAERDKRVKDMDLAKRLVPFSKLVDVKFDNATIKQAAEALSKASGLQIRADDSIPESTRVTVEARKIQLSMVLESIARQSGLTIDPINKDRGDLGAFLTQPPMLRVNDKVTNYRPSLSVWSNAWGISPTRRLIFSSTPLGTRAAQGGIGVYGNGKSAEVYANTLKGLSRTGTFTTLTTMNGETAVRIAGDKTIKLAKDGTITIIEPGKNDQGEDGYWTTVYTNKANGLTQDKKTWSKTK